MDIKGMIADIIEDTTGGKESIWKAPEVAFAAADDSLFIRLKEVVGPDHLLPSDLLPSAGSVITYFIPFSRELAQTNIPGKRASRAWGTAYLETNSLISEINRTLKEKLQGEGWASVSPEATHNFDEQSLKSSWSHRHVGYVAGLGTFGLNRMLITKRGCCGRIGSLVTEHILSPTPRPDREYCLDSRKKGSCGACRARCVGEVLGEDGFDRFRCYEICLENNRCLSDLDLTDVCGKCTVGVPCAHGIPG